MKYEIRNCVICGKAYTPNRTYQKICLDPDCRAKLRKSYENKRPLLESERDRAQRAMSQLKPNTLIKDALAAKKAGLSYGQYMASR